VRQAGIETAEKAREYPHVILWQHFFNPKATKKKRKKIFVSFVSLGVRLSGLGYNFKSLRKRIGVYMIENKKIAAVSAVLAYIKEEEDAVSALAMQRERAQRVSSCRMQSPISIWGVTGRQAQMQFRNLMQAKAFHGLRR
jgi:hypothetical protein